VYLWRHDSNSFHLKGISSDRKNHLLSGHNLNPRAWGLDLENGVLLEDPTQCLMPKIDNERAEILKHCQRINSYEDIDTKNDYPPSVKKLLRRANRVKFDSIIKRFI
jgi:CDP-diacylglycerol--serine O-phosphatidyltransferase